MTIPWPMTTMLFVPGDRPDRVMKAQSSGPRWVVVDLEDAVADVSKELAREGMVRALEAASPPGPARVALRVNALQTDHFEADLAASVAVWDRLGLILLPMVSDPATVRSAAARMAETDRSVPSHPNGPGLVPMIETAQGVEAAAAIAAADPRVRALAFGPADLSSQLGLTITSEGTELLYARSRLVMASAAAGLPGPVDGPWLNLVDEDGLRRSAAHARSLGFSGKLIIHPRQREAVENAFAPSPQELEWAREVIAAFAEAEQRGVASIRLADGTFVDYAVVSRARALWGAAPSA